MNSLVNITRRTALLIINSLMVFGLVLACTTKPTPTETPSISKDKAIEIAIGGCKTPHLVLIGVPTNIRAKLLTLNEADKLTSEKGETTNYEIPMDTLVWLVQMDGQLQLVGGPAPVITNDSQITTPTPSQPFQGTCSVILDANSGNLISVHG